GARYYHTYMMEAEVMVRWTLAPEWILVITIYDMDSFLHDLISLLYLLYFGHGPFFSFLFFFHHALSMCLSLFFY
ncbi:hypothetical protein BIFBRE_05110, partial [Bifidobacterium breve DSM 20213 = JCM 1192]